MIDDVEAERCSFSEAERATGVVDAAVISAREMLARPALQGGFGCYIKPDALLVDLRAARRELDVAIKALEVTRWPGAADYQRVAEEHRERSKRGRT